MWDHCSYKEQINTVQMCFMEVLQDIKLTISKFMSATTLFWLSDWMYASYTHFKYNKH